MSHEYALTICIASLRTRWPYLEKTMADLIPQITDDVQLLIDVDDGEVSTGAKRQRMLNLAKGRFCCAFDDDDPVDPNYVRLLSGAIRTTPGAHCIGFQMTVQVDDGPEVPFRGNMPSHLTPVRTELARKVGFKDITFGEDNDFAVGLAKVGADSPCEFIDRVLYRYKFRSDRSGEKMHEPFNADSRRPY